MQVLVSESGFKPGEAEATGAEGTDLVVGQPYCGVEELGESFVFVLKEGSIQGIVPHFSSIVCQSVIKRVSLRASDNSARDFTRFRIERCTLEK